MKQNKKTRKEAAQQLNILYNCYEARKNKLNTTYRKIYYKSGSWHLIGFAHDYTY